jgi:uncharacterized membrane protein
MSNLIVLTFDSHDEACRVRTALRDLEKRGRLVLDDTVVLEKDTTGKVHVDNQASEPVIIGAVVGGVMGLILTFMFPIVGVVFGAGAGALVGRVLDAQVDRQFVRDVQAALRPGTSALFLLVPGANADAPLAALRQFRGHVYQTTLAPQLEDELRAALAAGDQSPAS